tara:strand:- start:330 stop:701 length:372 start_codon:yes stop_codon:yes gene_type:complete
MQRRLLASQGTTSPELARGLVLSHLIGGTKEMPIKEEEVKEWQKKIKRLFDNPDIEKKIVNQYCHNDKNLMWKIDHMKFEPKELRLIYEQLTLVVAESASRTSLKKEAKEQKKEDKLKEIRGW